MGKQPQLSPDELLGHHVKYEIDQMVCSLLMLGNVKVPVEWHLQDSWQKALNNALIESFCVHARALFEFFEKPRGARKYTEATYEPFKGVDISTWVKKLNNQVAHLLDGRTDDDSLKIGDQHRIDMLHALGSEVEVFRKALKSEYKSIDIPRIPTMTIQALEPNATNANQAPKSFARSLDGLNRLAQTR
jgi:hypothetical protein